MATIEFIRPSGIPLRLDSAGKYALIDQFGGFWYIRCQDLIQGEELAVEIGNELYPLVPMPMAGLFRLPENAHRIGNASGVYRFYRMYYDEPSLLEPSLYVQPGSLTEEEYAKILDRLCQLAIAVEGAVMAPVESPVKRRPTNAPRLNVAHRPQHRLLIAAKLYIDFASIVQEQWPLIARLPAKTVRHQPQIIDTRRATRYINGLKRQVERPDLRRLTILSPTEIEDTPENRFLAYVLNEILIKKAKHLISALSYYATELRQRQAAWIGNKQYDRMWRERSVDLEEQAARFDVEAQQVQQVANWAQENIIAPFIHGSILQASIPVQPSQKLLKSREYSPIYHAFQHYQHQQINSLSSEGNTLLRTLEEKGIHRTNYLYELWVFLELYSLLVNEFGFTPLSQHEASRPETPFDLVEVFDGHPILKAESSYKLGWKASTSPLHDQSTSTIVIELCYDAKVKGGGKTATVLRPDVWIEILLNGREQFYFAIDAKYRRYKAKMPETYSNDNGIRTFFDLDFLITAKRKYKESLGTTAAFIVHSDSTSPQFTEWGGRQLKDIQVLNAPLSSSEQETFPDHQYGTIFASPNKEGISNLKRLIKCILMYHCKAYDICWHCRKNIVPEKVDKYGSPSNKGVGDAYQCCGEFWVKTNCQGRISRDSGYKHTLLKLGRSSFHQINPQDEWACVCPKCGDLFGDELVEVGDY